MTGGIDTVILQHDNWTLRAPDVADAADLLIMLRDQETLLWNPVAAVVDLATAADWCRASADWSDGDHATFSVLDAGQFVGTVAVHGIDRHDDVAEIGYRISPAHRGRGAGTAAVRISTNWALTELGIFRMALRHAVENPGSCRVADRAGYRQEGLLRSSLRGPDGSRYDEHLHARLADDPEPSR